jgi:hypothetical protein
LGTQGEPLLVDFLRCSLAVVLLQLQSHGEFELALQGGAGDRCSVGTVADGVVVLVAVLRGEGFELTHLAVDIL